MFTHELWVHGTRLLLETDMHEVSSNFQHDFAYFLNPETAFLEKDQFVIRHFSKEPCPWTPLVPSNQFRSKRAWSFGNCIRVCMFGTAQVEYDFVARYCHIYSSDPDVSYEVVYLATLSYLGESMDKRGCHRIHGFGFITHNVGGVLVAPSGGGKSTLAMELLKNQSTKIISDDTPVITKEGKMLAFPQRIALKERPNIDSKYCRQFKRFHFGSKFVVGADFFSDSIAADGEIKWLILSSKKRKKKAQIVQINRIYILWPLFKWLVVGYETPQIWEFFIRASLHDILAKLKILVSRTGTAFRVFSEVKVAHFTFSHNPSESANVFETFFQIKNCVSEMK
jgi:hypothetical protein